MEKENKVSIWLAYFDSENQLYDFVKDIYNEDGDATSLFMQSTGIAYYDSYKREVFFYGKNNNRSFLNDFSYSNTFVDKIKLSNVELSENNSIIFIYDFDFKAIKKSDNVKYIGTYDYQK